MAIKVQNTVCFSEIFDFAEKKYGIVWNDSCDIFHRKEVLTYKETNNFEPNVLCENIDNKRTLGDDTLKVFNSITDEDVNAEENEWRKAHLIIIRFMQDNDVTQLLVLNDC